MRADSLDQTELSFQHYKVLRQADGSPWELGRGSMGITYKAFDVNLCCDVALKVINAATLEHPRARERFVSEARAAAKLRHRNIASVYHLGNDGEHYFYAMEFVDGETLDALVDRQGPRPVATVLRILLQATRALAAAARQGLVHRDLKPANIMITHEDDDDDLLVKVIDFGLAKPINSADGSRPLTFGGFVGTPQFASPEQLEERRVDGRSDIYSLGATAWYLLTGRAPFVGSLATICHQHLTVPPPWTQLPPPFPETVRALLAQMLEKDPARRPADAVELRRQIEATLEVIREPQAGGLPAAPETSGKPGWFHAQRQRTARARPPSEGEAPRTGMILKGRYELLRLVGEGNSGRVFLARDRGEEDALVALKVLHAELVGTSAELARLGEEVRLIRGAEHPHLIRILAMESLPSQETAFLVEEWLRGFTLLEFLAVRGGALPMAEGLRLIGHAAAAADHAESRRLERLDFTLHQFHFHFPDSDAGASDTEAPRRPLQTPMAQWPAWMLKLNPLGALRNGLEFSTWAGDVTLVPEASAAHRPSDANPGKAGPSRRDLYTRGVARLTHELLGGVPASPAFGADQRIKFAALPALSEEANAVLQRALHEDGAFAGAGEFFRALSRAAGFDPAHFALPAVVQNAAKTGARMETARVSAAGAARVKAANTPRVGAVLKPAGMGETGARVGRPGVLAGPAGFAEATFGADGEVLRGSAGGWNASPTPDTPGTVWDRLALVSGEGSSSRLWMGGVAACFLALLIGSVAFLQLVGRHPVKPAPGSVAGKPYKPALSPLSARASAAAIRQTAGAAFTAKKAVPTAGLVTTTQVNAGEEARSPGAAVPGPDRPSSPLPNVAATPAPSPDIPPPLAGPAAVSSVRVHVDSKPAGVDVLLKGRLLGTTPFDASLPAGDHQLVARYKNWPEVRQALHLDESQASATTELRLMPPALVPTTTNVAGAPSPAPLNRKSRAEQDAIVRRNFVQSTRSVDTAGAATYSSPLPAGSAAEARRTMPALHPFDPDGVFRQAAPARDED